MFSEYIQMFGKARMEMKDGITFACMNPKKMVKIKVKMDLLAEGNSLIKGGFIFS